MAQSDDRVSSTVFTVRLDGLQLEPEVVARLDASIRRAVLTEFAALDLGKGIRLRGLDPFDVGGGGTMGIVLSAPEL